MGNTRIPRGSWTTDAGNNSCFARLSSFLFRRSNVEHDKDPCIYISLLRLRAFCFRFPHPPPHCSRFLSRILPRADRYKLQNAVGHCSTHRLVGRKRSSRRRRFFLAPVVVVVVVCARSFLETRDLRGLASA